jgi:Bacterial Ig domain
LANDTDPNGNATIDPTSVVLSNVPAELIVVNYLDGTVTVTAATAGQFTFNYTVADNEEVISNSATVTVNVADAPVIDTVVITRATFRTDKARRVIRGTSSLPGVTVRLDLERVGAYIGTIGTVTADVTGAWAIDVRNSPVIGQQNDIVCVHSSGGGVGEVTVTIQN